MKDYALIEDSIVIGFLRKQKEKPAFSNEDGIIAVVCDDSVVLGMAYDFESNVFYEYDTKVQESTQFEMVMQAIEKNADELRQEGADSLLQELIDRGVI